MFFVFGNDAKPLKKLERATRIELATPTLARSCSTAELHPHPYFPVAIYYPPEP